MAPHPPLTVLRLALMLPLFMVCADTPWAVEVIAYAPGENFFDGYDDAQVALGRPTVMTYKDMSEETPSVVVVPVYPAWEFDQIVSIGETGSLTLRMGKAITNDPANPYGIDFLIFGNAMITGSGLYNQQNNTPEGYTLSSSPGINQKQGVVSVSHDGVTWYTFTEGPNVGGMFPTLGRIWDEDAGAWGAETDPTVPPDPNVTPSQLANMTLVALIRHYRGGAGGTGFDLSWLDLPPDAPTSFHYVRIDVPEGGTRTEIDAVTVVSPATERKLWEIRHFSWLQAPAVAAEAVGVTLQTGGGAVLLHPDEGTLPGWRLEWSPSLTHPVWEYVNTVPPAGTQQYFRARYAEEDVP